jgi:DsbC/DsbD-like thiol-disulfide interchange protein
MAQAVPDAVLRAEVLPGWQTDRGTRMVALDLQLAPGWKTYWRAPGEAGIPPSFDWSGSDNIASVAFHWPVPQVFDLNGYRTLAFQDELVLPIEITPVDPARPIAVRADVLLGVCEDICVPVTLQLDQDLNGDGRRDSRIEAALDAGPEPARAAGLSAARCLLEPIRDGLRLTAHLTMPALGDDEVAVIEAGTGGVWVSEPQTERQGGTLVTTADLVPADAQPFALDRSTMTFTILAAGRAVEQRGCAG